MLLVLARAVVAVLSLLVLPLRLLSRWLAAPRGGFVHLELDGPLRERPPRRWWPLRPRRGTDLDAVRKLAAAMASDRRAHGLLVTVRSAGAPADRHALLEALRPLREAGKPIVAHLPQGGDTATLHVASVASHVLLSRSATLGPLGQHATTIHARRLLDMLGIVPEIIACGAYKSAGDMLSREELSEANRAQLERLLELSTAEVTAKLRGARGVDELTARGWLDEGLIGAERAVELGIVDELVHDDEVRAALSRLARGQRPEAPLVGASTYLRRRVRPLVGPVLPRPVVAIVPIEGAIAQSSAGGAGASAERLVPVLRALAEARRVRGVVLSIDSPGGGVLASEKIHRAVSLLAKKKPVVARLGNVAASGGYYVAVAAHPIVASPLTVTGSIGVVAARLSVGPLLERLGVRVEALREGARADLFSPARALEPSEREALEREIAGAYERFLEVVAEGRGRQKDEIRPLAAGRVWLGSDALAHGLVDRLGTLEDAVREVEARVGIRRLEARWVDVGGTPTLRALATRSLGQAAGAATSLLGFASPLGDERLLALHVDPRDE